MHTREAPDFWGLHKNKNSAFPLKFETSAHAHLVIVCYYILFKNFLVGHEVETCIRDNL